MGNLRNEIKAPNRREDRRSMHPGEWAIELHLELASALEESLERLELGE